MLKYDIALAALVQKRARSANDLGAFAKEFVPDGEDAPSGRSVIRWMNNLELQGEKVGAMVNRSGREKGWSQLPPIADRIVQQSMALFYSATALKKMDAHALTVAAWKRLKDQGVEGLGAKAPSKTTVVNRINRCESKETWTSKFGPYDADRHFLASGESVPLTRPFEQVFMDGTEFEQVSRFSANAEIPSSQLKVVQLIDGATLLAFPSTPFAGPYRSEMGMGAILGALTAPTLDEKTLAEDPMRVLFFGKIGRLRTDNDKAMIPPSAIGNLASVVTLIELARKYGPDEKSPIENYFGWLKARLDGEPGTVMSPRSRRRSIRRDPLAESAMTRASHCRKIEALRLEWNDTGHAAIGYRKPNDLMLEFISTLNTRLIDPGEVRRHMARTVVGVLTTDGVTFDNVTYKWNRTGITKLLSENLASQAFSKRLEGTARVEVWLRVYDWNLDFVEVLNESNNEFVTSWSDDPDYTEFLSRYEHSFHQSNVISGETGAQTIEQRALRRAQSLEEQWEDIHNEPYQIAKKAATILATAEVSEKAKKCIGDPDLTKFEGFLIRTEVAGQDRIDGARGPSQRRTGIDEDGLAKVPKSKPTPTGPWGGLEPHPPADEDHLDGDAPEPHDPTEPDLDDGLDWGDD